MMPCPSTVMLPCPFTVLMSRPRALPTHCPDSPEDPPGGEAQPEPASCPYSWHRQALPGAQAAPAIVPVRGPLLAQPVPRGGGPAGPAPRVQSRQWQQLAGGRQEEGEEATQGSALQSAGQQARDSLEHAGGAGRVEARRRVSGEGRAHGPMHGARRRHTGVGVERQAGPLPQARLRYGLRSTSRAFPSSPQGPPRRSRGHSQPARSPGANSPAKHTNCTAKAVQLKGAKEMRVRVGWKARREHRRATTFVSHPPSISASLPAARI